MGSEQSHEYQKCPLFLEFDSKMKLGDQKIFTYWGFFQVLVILAPQDRFQPLYE